MGLSNDLSCEAGSLSCCRGLRLYFPELEPWVTRSASLPTVCPVYLCAMWGCGVLPAALPALFSATLSLALSVYLCANVAPQGLLAVRLPALCQSQSRHSNASPLRHSCPSPSLLLVWMNVYFLSSWCRTSLPFDFLSVLVV